MFQTAKSFLFFLTLGVIFQGLITHGLIKVVITSIEKRFSLKSTESGTIASSFDAGSLLLMIPVTYFGGKLGAFVQYLGDGPMIMEKVVHIPKCVKSWYIYQLILSQLS